jgi:hypothetical protein
MLSLMALLDRQAVPDVLLHQGNKRTFDSITWITTLKAFSLVAQEKKSATFGMHRLVQLSTQRWLELEGSLLKWQEIALARVSECCPVDCGYESWTTWETLYPHIRVVLQYPFATESSQLQRARILNIEQGQHEAAQEKCVEALSIREKLLLVNHCDMLESISTMACVPSRLPGRMSVGQSQRGSTYGRGKRRSRRGGWGVVGCMGEILQKKMKKLMLGWVEGPDREYDETAAPWNRVECYVSCRVN